MPSREVLFYHRTQSCFLTLKKNILIAGIIREGKAIIPNGNDVIMKDDNVIVVTTNPYLEDLSDILE